MNLADAIRKASQQTGNELAPNGQTVPPSPTAQFDAPKTAETHGPSAPNVSLRPPIAGTSEVVNPADPSPIVNAGGGSVVRLELFLSPEQVHQMLRGIFQGSHSVMTLREAAQYLRVHTKSLIEIAESGELPAFMVDGAWKFPRHAIDEWITLQTLKETTANESEERDVA
jgi:excisionase family DNA binding protein